MHSGYEWFWPDYANCVRTVLESGPEVLDVGTPVSYRKELGRVPPPDKLPRIYTLDMPSSQSPDVSVFGDAAYLPFPDAQFDGVICKEVLEHVTEPIHSASELVRVLRPGGRLFATMIYVHPYHAGLANGSYGDYWRFTRDAIPRLFPGLELRVRPAGGLAFVARAYTRGRLLEMLMSSRGTRLLNRLDRLIPTRNVALMYYVLGSKPL